MLGRCKHIIRERIRQRCEPQRYECQRCELFYFRRTILAVRGGGVIVSIDSKYYCFITGDIFPFLSYVCYRVHMNKLNIKIVSFVDDPAL